MNGTPTVYVVEDDAQARRALGACIGTRGHKSEFFATAESFLAAYDPSSSGCLVLDLSLPGKSGLELQEKLAADGHTIPIIFITGHGCIQDSVRAIKAGAVDFLEKPYSAEVLLGRIDEALARDMRDRDEHDDRKSIQARFARLTGRERQIAAMLVESLGNTCARKIAADLGISGRTVEFYRFQAMRKLDIHGVPELIEVWRRGHLDSWTQTHAKQDELGQT